MNDNLKYLYISKDDIPDEPDTLHADVIESLREESMESNITPLVMPRIIWVRLGNRKWGFADLDSHWFFAFKPCNSLAPIVILPPVTIITIAPIEPPNPYEGGVA